MVVNYANQKEKATEVARGIEALGRRSLVVKADVSSQKEVLAMRDTVMAEFKGGVEILVNNAGIHHHLKSWEIDEDEWKRIMAVNVDGVFLCTKAFTPQMRIEEVGKGNQHLLKRRVYWNKP